MLKDNKHRQEPGLLDGMAASAVHFFLHPRASIALFFVFLQDARATKASRIALLFFLLSELRGLNFIVLTLPVFLHAPHDSSCYRIYHILRISRVAHILSTSL